MAHGVEVVADLPEDLSLVTSIHFRQLTTTYSPSYNVSYTLSASHRYLHTHDTHLLKHKRINKN